APLAGELLRLACEEAHDQRVDSDERLREAGARDRDERRVEAGRDRLREHRLAGSRGAEEEQASLALAARPLERLARLPERDDAAHLFLRLGLAAHVLELHAPLGVAGLVAADLRDAHQHQRAHEDEEVREEQEEDDDDLHPEGAAVQQPPGDAEVVGGRAPPGAMRRVEEDALQPQEGDEPGDPDRDPVPEAPRPRAATVDDVLLAQARLLGAEEARPRDQPPDDQVDEAAEADHDPGGRGERGADAEVLVMPEPEVRRGARQDRDRSGDASQPAQLRGEGHRLLARAKHRGGGRFSGGRHPSPQSRCRSAYPVYARMDSLDFSHQEIERATRYHRPRYLSSAADLASSTAVLAVLQWAWAGPWRLVDGLGWAGAAAAYTGLVSAGLLIVQLPVSFWRGHLRERRYGFSTQGAAGWAWDRAKGEAIGLVVLAGFWVGLVGLARALPSGWPAVAAAIVALLVFVVSFLSPVVLEPIFNRFRPLEDRRLADALLALAGRAGVPVREVLVADASRRTTKLNAYVSGIGRTRRVVLYDTLLDAADEGQLQL